MTVWGLSTFISIASSSFHLPSAKNTDLSQEGQSIRSAAQHHLAAESDLVFPLRTLEKSGVMHWDSGPLIAVLSLTKPLCCLQLNGVSKWVEYYFWANLIPKVKVVKVGLNPIGAKASNTTESMKGKCSLHTHTPCYQPLPISSGQISLNKDQKRWCFFYVFDPQFKMPLIFSACNIC